MVFRDIAKSDLYIEPTDKRAFDTTKVWDVHPIVNGSIDYDSKGFVYLHNDGKVEIDVSGWGAGRRGSQLYAAVGNWAHNTGHVFAGDRRGISPDGMLRRLENMISLALKFGTTDFIEPHADMLDALEFNWKPGNVEYNLDQMLNASYNAIKNGVFKTYKYGGIEVTEKTPEAEGYDKLDDLEYNFSTGQFEDITNGTPYTDADFQSDARRVRATLRAGMATLKRAVVTKSILRSLQDGSGLEGSSLFPDGGNTERLRDTLYSRSSAQINPTPEEHARIQSAIDLARDAGIGDDVISKIKSIVVVDGGLSDASLSLSNGTLKINRASLSHSDAELQFMVHHEVGHALDFENIDGEAYAGVSEFLCVRRF